MSTALPTVAGRRAGIAAPRICWPALPGYVLFFLMLTVPTSYAAVKAPLLALTLLLVSVQAVRRGRFALHPTVAAWTLVCAGTGVLFCLLGVANGAPGALRAGTVYVLWPLVYVLLGAGMAPSEADDNLNVVRSVLRVLVAGALAVEAYTLLFIGHAAGIVPAALYVELDLGQSIGFYDGTVEFGLYSLSSLLFLVPFLLAALMVWPKDADLPVRRGWLWLALALGIALVFLSGRRALQIVVACAPVFTLGLWRLLGESDRAASRPIVRRVILGTLAAGMLLFVFLQARFGLDWGALTANVARGFDWSGNDEAALRSEQFQALITGWQRSPLFGSGHGATVVECLRSEEQPWAYELSYAALLFHSGLIGLGVLGAAVLWTYRTALGFLRRPPNDGPLGRYLLPVLVGTTCFLIGNATNPYLEKYDFLWVIFLPVALVNGGLLRKGTRRAPVKKAVASRRPG